MYHEWLRLIFTWLECWKDSLYNAVFRFTQQISTITNNNTLNLPYNTQFINYATFTSCRDSKSVGFWKVWCHLNLFSRQIQTMFNEVHIQAHHSCHIIRPMSTSCSPWQPLQSSPNSEWFKEFSFAKINPVFLNFQLVSEKTERQGQAQQSAKQMRETQTAHSQTQYQRQRNNYYHLCWMKL